MVSCGLQIWWRNQSSKITAWVECEKANCMEESGNGHKLVEWKTIMIKSGTSRLMIIAALFAGATACLASEGKQPDPNYTYTDDFNGCKVVNDSYYHSIFWPQGAFPPSEPYLYYNTNGLVRELGFGDYHGVQAELVYRFPFQQAQKIISGELQVVVRFLYANSGNLDYSLSSDGINWSSTKRLTSETNIIHIKSIRGICYIKFKGMGALIDNLEVNLHSDPADYFVELGAVSPKFATIQDAIDYAITHAAYGDKIQIEVASGTYKCHDIDFEGGVKGGAIIVYSKMGPEQTTIDCENASRGFYFHTGEDSNSVLRGFTVKNGKKTGQNVPIDAPSWTQNSSYPVGAGVYCELSSPSIVDCIIQNCSAQLGAGIGIVGASPYIADCVIHDCNAGNFVTDHSYGGYGAGIALIRDSNAVIVNTMIKNNTIHYNSFGGGVYCHQSNVLLANCEIRNNKYIRHSQRRRSLCRRTLN
jgi:hypothetical protein